MQVDDKSMTWTPFHILGEERASRWLIICDHATNRVPPGVANGDLGLAPEDMDRHIAFDVGAAGVAIRLAEKLNAPAILSNFSRLVIDPNRGTDDPTLLMRLYDGTLIPANRHADNSEVSRRLDMCYRPYDDAIERLAARQTDTVIVSVHSFTPQFKGRAIRPWHVGILYGDDARLSVPFLNELRKHPDWVVGANEPYSGHLPGDTIYRHALTKGRQNTLIEIRNDLIADDAGQTEWADNLAPMLEAALATADV